MKNVSKSRDNFKVQKENVLLAKAHSYQAIQQFFKKYYPEYIKDDDQLTAAMQNIKARKLMTDPILVEVLKYLGIYSEVQSLHLSTRRKSLMLTDGVFRHDEKLENLYHKMYNQFTILFGKRDTQKMHLHAAIQSLDMLIAKQQDFQKELIATQDIIKGQQAALQRKLAQINAQKSQYENIDITDVVAKISPSKLIALINDNTDKKSPLNIWNIYQNHLDAIKMLLVAGDDLRDQCENGLENMETILANTKYLKFAYQELDKISGTFTPMDDGLCSKFSLYEELIQATEAMHNDAIAIGQLYFEYQKAPNPQRLHQCLANIKIIIKKIEDFVTRGSGLIDWFEKNTETYMAELSTLPKSITYYLKSHIDFYFKDDEGFKLNVADHRQKLETYKKELHELNTLISNDSDLNNNSYQQNFTT